ncbi:MAG: site-2 protease family protein [Clostridia bacterium]|nr:site-2 protease family protein [Clostridia bacterium]
MNVILTVILTLFIFGALIAIHELGHYLVARFFKVGIREYSIGMGPKLFQKQGKYNKFTLRALPIGGFVDMVGEAADDDGSDPEDEGKPPLNTKPVWQRMLIVLAGPAMNVLLGLLIMAIIVLFQSELYGTKIGGFADNNVSGKEMVYVTADGNGFEKGDIIYAVDGKAVTGENGIEAFLKDHGNAEEIVVFRKNSSTILNPISYENVKLSALPLEYNGEKKYFVLSENSGSFQKGDVIYSLGETVIADQSFGSEGATDEERLNALKEAYPNAYTVGIVRYYKVFLEPETFSYSFESFKELPLYVDDGGMLKFSEQYGEIQKNAQVLEVNGEKIPEKMTADEFAAAYGDEKGELTLKYNWYVQMANPIILKNAKLEGASLAISGALQVGDEIKEVGSYNTPVPMDLNYGVFNEGIEPTDITVIRDGKELVVENVVFHKASEQGILCGRPDFYVDSVEKTFGSVCHNAVFQPLSSLKMTVDGILQTFKGKYGIEALSGPVGIGEQIGQAVEAEDGGIEYLFNLIVMISLSLGICNLLPLPVLDGGRFLLYAIEGVRRKPLPPKAETIIMGISWVLVLGLMVFVMFKDVIGLFN